MKINPLKQNYHLNEQAQPLLSITCANEYVLKTYMEYAKEQGTLFMVEATVNQCDQFGGYTGMKPADYAQMIKDLANDVGLPIERTLLSGDHLGPFTVQHQNEKEAMEYSKELVRHYVAAGFRKVHLDTSMRLADDDRNAPLDDAVSTRRAVELAKVSEETFAKTAEDTPWNYRPVYVIGSEVPVPGGLEDAEELTVTSGESLHNTLNSYRKAFDEAGLSQVMDDVVAVVAQIGVEFSDESVHDFRFDECAPLAAALKDHPGIVFESHSSDYQTAKHLSEMAQSGVGILKVGPELTFGYREGLMALEHIEKELAPLHPDWKVSDFGATLENVMLNSTPNYWVKYYHGNDAELLLKRKYSFSDRSRYYFANKDIIASVDRLLANLAGADIPLTLISQYMGVQYTHIREGLIPCTAEAMLKDKILDIVRRYHGAIK